MLKSGTQVSFKSRSGVELIGDIIGLIDDSVYEVEDYEGEVYKINSNELEAVD